MPKTWQVFKTPALTQMWDNNHKLHVNVSKIYNEYGLFPQALSNIFYVRPLSHICSGKLHWPAILKKSSSSYPSLKKTNWTKVHLRMGSVENKKLWSHWLAAVNFASQDTYDMYCRHTWRVTTMSVFSLVDRENMTEDKVGISTVVGYK